ncbi:MAG: AAA family ATPase [Pseudomonadales bacterium]|nr:AAA family ATPase [Pseudomonadales bacterium]
MTQVEKLKTGDCTMQTEENKTLLAAKQKQSSSNADQVKALGWVNDYILLPDEINAIEAPTWIINNLIISGHIILIPAEPNAGKTTIFFHLAGEMVKEGFSVNYVNADISGGDAKPLYEEAKINKFNLLLPDMKGKGKSMDSVIKNLAEMSHDSNRYDDVVFIFDTLKKMLDVIQKSAAKEFFKLFRRLSAKGMTIILLAHTNKYNNETTGLPIYEGTGDLRSDVDELIYLLPQKHENGAMTVTTHPDKIRGTFKPITFEIDSNRKVTLLKEAVNTLVANQVKDELAKDQSSIDAIIGAIESGCKTQKEIIESCDDINIGERTVKRILIKYSLGSLDHNSSPRYWSKARGEKNSSLYSLLK